MNPFEEIHQKYCKLNKEKYGYCPDCSYETSGY
jgi:hypothetical protein